MADILNRDVVTNVVWQWLRNEEEFIHSVRDNIAKALSDRMHRVVERAFREASATDTIDNLACDAIAELDAIAWELEDTLTTWQQDANLPHLMHRLRRNAERATRSMKQLEQKRRRLVGGEAVSEMTSTAPAGSEKKTSSGGDDVRNVIPF